MPKDAIKIGVRVVQRPSPSQAAADGPYKPPKAQVYKAIATCSIAGQSFSKTATSPSEDESRQKAFSKMASLVAKHGAVPVAHFGTPESNLPQ